MLSFFRRIINSKLGVIVTFITLGVIALAFAAGDVSNLQMSGSADLGNNEVAEIGDETITVADLRSRAQDELEAARQQQPTLDMAAFLSGGGLDGSLQRLITTTSLAEFGREQGMVVSKRLVDGEIASLPGLQGPTGKFDERLYRRILAERRLTDAQVRQDIARGIMVQQLTGPTVGAGQVPEQVALPYASLLLERRTGQVGVIPASAMKVDATPTPQDVQSFYGRNLARYRVPERRTVRYALVTPDQVRGRATPSEAEIGQYYAQNRASYQPTERRTVEQVVVADQAGANAIAAKVRGGTALAAAAQAAGLEASTVSDVDKAAYANQTSPALADAVFAAARGAVVGPVRSPLGFVVARVANVQQVAGRTLAEAREDIVTALTQQKTAAALADVRESLDDALADNVTFDEAVADAKLQPRTTPPLAAGGINPDQPTAQPDPALAPLVNAAFAAENGDAPQLVQTGEDGSFAVVAVGQVLPAAPRPLAQIRDRVVADLVADRRRQAARRVAGEVLAKVNRGASLAQALAQTGLALPAPRQLNASRVELARAQGGADPALALMFSMAQGSTKLLEAPTNSGWQLVKLEKIQRGDAARVPGAVKAARSDISRLIGREYADQFARAVRAEVGVKTDADAVSRVRADLAGQGGSN